MSYTLKTTRNFRKDVERCIKRGLSIEKLRTVMELLTRDGQLPKHYRPHILRGNRRGQWECHIEPNWLLVWEQDEDELILLMINTGTHSDLFGKKGRK